jgi:hypothetical protein
MPGDGGLGKPKQVHEVAYTKLACGEQVEEPKPCRIGEALKEGIEPLNGFGGNGSCGH